MKNISQKGGVRISAMGIVMEVSMGDFTVSTAHNEDSRKITMENIMNQFGFVEVANGKMMFSSMKYPFPQT